MRIRGIHLFSGLLCEYYNSFFSRLQVVENEAMEKYYQGLEKKEMLEEKLSSIMEISTTAYVCIKVLSHLTDMRNKLLVVCQGRMQRAMRKFGMSEVAIGVDCRMTE